MKSVRLGVIGLGNIGRHHANYLHAGQVCRGELTAVCTSVPNKAAAFPGVRSFVGAEDLMTSGLVDAVIVATPHYQHTGLGIAALERGLHLMVEKPISAHKADAERLISAARVHPELVFAAMFQLRVEPRYLVIRKLVQSGELGEITRVNWVMTDWYRTEAYYSSGGWRATWRGEGGGVLLNQCLHNLDILQWILGMPLRVRGFCQLGRFHNIEVEDQVSAYFEYRNRATGIFVSSTGEAPGTNRLEITGTRGRLILEQDKLGLIRNETDVLEFSKQAKSGFAKPETHYETIAFGSVENPHAVLIENFVNAILDQQPLQAPGQEGIHSIELANGILFSSLLNQTLEFPIDGAAWETELQRLVAGSKHKKQMIQVDTDDFTASFRK